MTYSLFIDSRKQYHIIILLFDNLFVYHGRYACMVAVAYVILL